MSYKVKLINGAGILWILFFGFRYLIQYLDKSQAIWGVGSGIGLLYVAWSVNRFENMEKKYDEKFKQQQLKIQGIDDAMEEVIKYEKE